MRTVQALHPPWRPRCLARECMAGAVGWVLVCVSGHLIKLKGLGGNLL